MLSSFDLEGGRKDVSESSSHQSQLTALGIPNAANLLEKYSWNVEKAVSAYFDGIEPSNTSNISKTKQSSLKRESAMS